MMKFLKIFIFFVVLVFNYNVNAKPVPPGAGDGDVPANILFLVDSSASMGRWIGTDGLGPAAGVAYDSQGRILIGQNVRRSIGSIVRYTADGERDTNFRPVRRITNAGCTQETDRNVRIARRNFRKASTIKFWRFYQQELIMKILSLHLAEKDECLILYLVFRKWCNMWFLRYRWISCPRFDINLWCTPYILQLEEAGGAGSFFKS